MFRLGPLLVLFLALCAILCVESTGAGVVKLKDRRFGRTIRTRTGTGAAILQPDLKVDKALIQHETSVSAPRNLGVVDIGTAYRDLAGSRRAPSLDSLRTIAGQFTINESPIYAQRDARVAQLDTEKTQDIQVINTGPGSSQEKQQKRNDRLQRWNSARDVEELRPVEIRNLLALTPCVGATSTRTKGPVGDTNRFTYHLDQCHRVTRVQGRPVSDANKGQSNPNGVVGSYTDIVYHASTGHTRPVGKKRGCFDAGHIVGAAIGGSWTNSEPLNFIPQERIVNGEGNWFLAEKAVKALRRARDQQGSIEIDLTFAYDPMPVLIPTGGSYTIRWDAAIPLDPNDVDFNILAGYTQVVGRNWYQKTINWVNA